MASEISHLRTKNDPITSAIAILRQVNTSLASEFSRTLSRTTAEKELISRKARCEELEKSKDYFGSETLRLSAENSDLKSQRVQADRVQGSFSFSFHVWYLTNKYSDRNLYANMETSHGRSKQLDGCDFTSFF